MTFGCVYAKNIDSNNQKETENIKNLNTAQYINGVTRSPEYLKDGKEGIGLPERVSRAAGALALRETRESGYRTHEGDGYEVISRVDSFAASQMQLETIRARNGTHKEKEPYLTEVIKFNHAVKAMMNNNAALEFSEAMQFIDDIYLSSHQTELRQLSLTARLEKLAWFHKWAQIAASGMRNELGAEQIIGCLDGVEYEETTVEDEKKGIDYFVTINNKTAGIDLKGKEADVLKIQAAHPYRKNVVWSQLTPADFNGTCRISPAVAQSKATAMRQRLEEACLAV